MKVKTSILNGAALDWAVCVCEDESPSRYTQYSTDWAQAGPIIERELLTLDYNPLTPHGRPWIATTRGGAEEYGATPLIAAMRAYVSSTFGDDVDIPEDLL
jgi:hypothetical protein